MPYTKAVSFDQFLEIISLSGKHEDVAESRRNRLTELLENQLHVLDTIPTGSLVHETALLGQADLDIITVLHYGKHIKGRSPKAVLELVRDTLSDYAKIVKKNGQAVTLYYTKWPDVDVVPASRVVNDDASVNYYRIPDMIRNTWIKTRPRRHNKAMARSSQKQRQLIRMIKCWNRAHSSLMQSYHISVLVLSLPDITSDWPFEIKYFFAAALESIEDHLYHPDGGQGAGPVDEYLDRGTRQEVKKRLSGTLQGADAAYKANHQEAIRLYRIIFGNDFPAYG